MTNYDVIITGAGTAGSMAAAALANKGLKVGLFDRQPKEKIGVKVCGDATSGEHFKRIQSITKVEPPQKKYGEVIQNVKGAWLYSPDREVKLELIEEGGTGIIIDRFKLGMRILENAIDFGADLIDNSFVKEPIITNDYVTGIKYRGKDKNIHEATGKVIIDASGIIGMLRTRLDPEKTFMDLELLPKDVCNCYREIRDVEPEIESPEFIRLIFDQDLCPGGYLWEFPRGPHSMNAGLGVMRINQLNPRSRFNMYLDRSKDLYKDSKLIHGGGWRVPLRRPQDNLVWNGFMLIGDSGTQVKPTDGGGIGISVNAAAMASKTIISGIENDDVSMNNLWDYNVQFMRSLASINAPLAIMKDFIIPLPSSIINEIFHKKVLGEDDLLYGNAQGKISGGFTTNLLRAWRGKRILGTLLKFRNILKKMDTAQNLYENFPSDPNEFLNWRQQILSIYGEN
ncbi:MAG: geranylgeranyl reductase family protein [Candidatus Hodarchaeales archaeon]|jgi:digeranylgeranylglycerophospholipid reductase